MTAEAPSKRKVHHGQNIRRMRDILYIKQDDLANDLGLSQQAVSQLEQRETLEPEMLEKVAKALNVSPEAIKNFSEEAVINYVNAFHDHSVNNGAVYAFHSNINPIDKLLEVLDEIKRLNEQNTSLYERLLRSEQEKVAIVQSMTAGREV